MQIQLPEILPRSCEKPNGAKIVNFKNIKNNFFYWQTLAYVKAMKYNNLIKIVIT